MNISTAFPIVNGCYQYWKEMITLHRPAKNILRPYIVGFYSHLCSALCKHSLQFKQKVPEFVSCDIQLSQS